MPAGREGPFSRQPGGGIRLKEHTPPLMGETRSKTALLAWKILSTCLPPSAETGT